MEAVERMKGKRIIKPIVYGNTATPFGYKRESDQHTHQWTVFLKMFNDDNPSDFIRKVQFKLHDSYAVNTRVCDKPPYEVTETGWGEFEIQMRIYFVDVNEKPLVYGLPYHFYMKYESDRLDCELKDILPIITVPSHQTDTVTVFHYLRLFQPLLTPSIGSSQVVSEQYDEIVFQEPTIPMFKALTSSEGKKHDRKKFHSDLMQICRRTVQNVVVCKEEIQQEIDDLRESLRAAHKLILRYKAGNDQDSNNSTPDVSICQ